MPVNITPNLHLNKTTSNDVLTYFIQVNNTLNTEHRYRIKSSHSNTIRGLIGYYTKQLQRADRFKTLDRSPDPWNLPLFETNNGNIKAASVAASANTVKNHRQRMRDVGFFVEEFLVPGGIHVALSPIFFIQLWDGTNYKTLVEKYVKYVISARNSDPEKDPKIDLKAFFLSIFDTNIRKSIKKEDYRPVDNLPKTDIGKHLNQVISGSPNGALSGEGKGRKYSSDGEKVAKPEKKERVRTAIRGSEKKKRSSAGAGAATAIFLMSMTTRFWAYLSVRLYAGRGFSEAKTQKIIEVLYENYFANDRG